MKTLLVVLAALVASQAATSNSPDGGAPRSESSLEFRGDLYRFCNCEVRSGASKTSKEAERARLIANYVAASRPGAQFLEFFEMLSTLHPIDKAPILLAAAHEAGLSTCPLAESSERETEAALVEECETKANAAACSQLQSVRANWVKALAGVPKAADTRSAAETSKRSTPVDSGRPADAGSSR